MALKKTFIPEVGVKFGGRMQKPKPSSSAPEPVSTSATVVGYELPPAFRDTKQSGFIPPEQKQSSPNNTVSIKPGSSVPNEKPVIQENKARVIGYETPPAFRHTKGTDLIPPEQKMSVQNKTILPSGSHGGPNSPSVIPESKVTVIGSEPLQVFRDTKQSGFVPPVQHDHVRVFSVGDTPFKPV